MTGVPRLEQLRNGDPAGATAQRLDAGDRVVDFLLPVVLFGHDSDDRAAMSGDEDGFSVFDVVEQLGEMRFGLDA